MIAAIYARKSTEQSGVADALLRALPPRLPAYTGRARAGGCSPEARPASRRLGGWLAPC